MQPSKERRQRCREEIRGDAVLSVDYRGRAAMLHVDHGERHVLELGLAVDSHHNPGRRETLAPLPLSMRTNLALHRPNHGTPR